MLSSLPRPVAALILGVVVLVAAPVEAQVDCSNPDNLCTGDPCVIPAVVVQTPCAADFGSRRVVVSGALSFTFVDYPDGILDLTAGGIDVQGTIRAARHVTLTATGDVEVERRLRVFGRRPDLSSVTIQAGGDVHLKGAVQAAGTGGYAGSIVVNAGGDLTADRKLLATYGGSVDLTADGDIVVGGGVNVSATPVNRADGFAGTVSIHANGSVLVKRPVRARGRYLGGDLTVSGGAGVTLERGANVADLPGGPIADGGAIHISSAGGDVAILGRVSARGESDGGVIRASGANVFLDGRFDVRSSFSIVRGSYDSGTIEASASGNLTASGRYYCAPDGCLAFHVGATLDTSGATFDKPPVADCPGSPSGAFLDMSVGALD